MRKMPNLVSRTYWIANSLDNAEHNKYIVEISMSPKVLESVQGCQRWSFQEISMTKGKTKWKQKITWKNC